MRNKDFIDVALVLHPAAYNRHERNLLANLI